MAADTKPTAQVPFTDGRPPHLPCRFGDVARDVLLPGDPDRVTLLKNMLEDVQDFGRKREFALITGRYKGHPVTICSSGIGGPSTEIALIELKHLGAERVVRIGGMSALLPEICTGSYLVPDRAIGMTGVGALYTAEGFEAVADDTLAASLRNAAAELGLTAHRGTIASTDSYYLGQDRPLPSGAKGAFLEAFIKQGAAGCEMESQVVLSVCRALGLKAACLIGTHGNRATNEWLVDYELTQRNLLHIAGRALAQASCPPPTHN